MLHIYSAFPGGNLTKKPARMCCAPASARKCSIHSGPRSLVDASALLWKQGGFVDRLRDLLPQEQASVVIETVVLSGIDAAQTRLLRRRREAGKVALHARQHFGCDIKSELVAKIEPQGLFGCETCSTVSAGIRRVGRGFS